VVTGVTA
nr:Chain A, Alpha-synuclein [Homo sapiens]